jgi:hypothetical protein
MPENEMTRLETALAALDPRPAALDRDRLMFLAGQRSAARRGWAIPCISAALASAATLVGVLVLYRPEAQVVIVPSPPVQQAESPNAVLAVNDSRWREQVEGLRLRNEVMLRGIEALPEPEYPGERQEPLTIDSLLQ